MWCKKYIKGKEEKKILFQRDEAVFLIVFLHHLLYQRISESWKFDIYDIVAELEGEPLISDLASLLKPPTGMHWLNAN